jgi:hypothetical protein
MQIADGDRFMHTSGSSLIWRLNYTAYRSPSSTFLFTILLSWFLQCLQRSIPVGKKQMKWSSRVHMCKY